MKVTAAFVLRGEIEEINNLEDFIDSTDVQIVYQKSHADRLYITEVKP